MKSSTAAGFVFDNPAVIDLSNGTDVTRTESGQGIADGRGGNPPRRRSTLRRLSLAPRTLCRESASPVNSVGFLLLILSGILCVVSAFSPIWIYYPKRYPPAQLDNLIIKYPFPHASWRGLWATCYKLPDLNPRLVDSQWPDECIWFGERDTAWESIPRELLSHDFSVRIEQILLQLTLWL